MQGSCEHDDEPSGSLAERLVTFQEGHGSVELHSYLAHRFSVMGLHTLVLLGYVCDTSVFTRGTQSLDYRSPYS
jgi:hypothetical protein